MLSDKKAGPFKVEIACIKVVNPPGQAPQKAKTSPGQSPATRPDVQPKLSAFIVDGVNGCDRAGAKDYAAFPGFFSLEPS